MFDPLRKYLYWSLGLHATAVLLLLISPYLPFGKAFRLHDEKIMWVSLPKGSTNQIGTPFKKSENLPKTTIEQQKKTLEAPPAGDKKPAMTYKPTLQKKTTPPKQAGTPDSKIDDALNRMKKQAAKQAVPEAAQIPNATPGGFTYGSNKGQYVSPQDPEYVMYQAKIRQRIMNEWILPLKYSEQALGLGESPLICKIVVHINERGEVTQTGWEQKSGNPSFDMSAFRAVEKAAPLDIPPERLKYEVYSEGFIVEFKPQAKP